MLEYSKSKIKALPVGEKDVVSKELIKEMAKDISRHILKIEIADDMELIDKEFTRIEKRDADLVYKNGQEIVHIEIQNNYHPKMHLRMHRYLSDILFEYETYTVKQYLLYIGDGIQKMKNAIKQHKLDYSYDIIDIRDIPCKSFLQSDDPSAVVLAILCDFEGQDKQEVVNTILKKLLKLSPDEMSFRNYLKKVEIYSTNRTLEIYVEKGEAMLAINIEEMPSFKQGLQKGVEQGLQKGVKKGLEQGLARGKQETLKRSVKAFISLGHDTKKIAELLEISQEEIQGSLEEDSGSSETA